ncbi:hypothetical protein [Marinovum sp.]|uniref:hypothetical protein n=1 Tax=Marinovum sp. TaxID=2024839 RepID=UPI002B26B240|nr:hypothetical protein [Marinovum sp.]
MTLVMSKPRQADPGRVRNAVTGLREVLGDLPDNHDFGDYKAFEAAFWIGLDGLEAAFRKLCKDGRISRNDEYCTIAGFGGWPPLAWALSARWRSGCASLNAA